MKICFWGNIAGAINAHPDGGGELQIALLAKALAIGGHEVVIIDYQTNENFVTTEGIKVFKINGWNNGIPGFRYLTHRIPQLYRSLKNQKADIYYCRIRDFRHVLAFWAARKVKAKFILGLASDLDILGFRMKVKYDYIPNFGYGGGLWWLFNGILNETVYPWLLRKADLVLVQHERQKNTLLKRHIKSIVFPNLFDLSKIPILSGQIHKDFVYVGSLDRRKGFIEFFELVAKTPLLTFKVIGSPRDKTGYLFYEKIKSFQNVSLLGKLCHTDTLYQIANSKALISTSPMEGFPNIFIEAWACGIPVLSLFIDPCAIIKSKGLGVITNGDMDELIQAMNITRNTSEFAERARAYVKDNHGLTDNKIIEISNLFTEICKR